MIKRFKNENKEQMKTNIEIRDKVIELLGKNNITLPEHETESSKGISRLMMYYNKHSTEDMKKEMRQFFTSKQK